jgi:type IV pilus assembly protein PilM
MIRSSRNKPVTGLDIEPGAVTAARVSVNGHITVEQAATAPLAPNVVRDGDVTDVAAVADALRELWAANKGLPKDVRVGAANARIVMRVMDLPPLEDPKELEAVVRHHASQDLPIPLENAALDFRPLGTVDTVDGPRLRTVVVAARRDLIEHLVAAVRTAGLRPAGVDLSAFAMVRALRTDEAPALYLSVGGLTNLAVADGRGCLFTRVTGGGLEHMVQALAERAAAPIGQARGWILRAGITGTDAELEDDPETLATVRTVLVAGVRQIAGEVRSSIDFHQMQARGDAAVDRVLLTGAAASVPGFAETLCTELGLTVEARAVDSAADDDLDPARLSIAAGLAVAEVPA